MAKILVMAQSPKSKRNLQSPLKGTRSWEVFRSWTSQANLPLEILEFRNVTKKFGKLPTISSKALRGKFLTEILEYPVIVCLGRYAEEAIRGTRELYFPNVSGWDHFFLPHPSGLNRQLNDPNAHHQAVAELRKAHEKYLTLKTYEGRIST